ncbi:MAG: 16S rRNA processing protein RimM [Bacteroidetes bacterium]|nr:16S rRNA processing protein RimM [Bacteroidota bacterium]
MPDINEFISVGKIVKPIGVKGNLKVVYLTDFPERFNELDKVYLFNENKEDFLTFNSEFEFEISEKKIFSGYVNIRLHGFSDKDSVKDFIGAVVMIPESDRVELPEDNFYFYDLIGAEVFDKGKRLGVVDSFSDFGSGDLLNIIIDGRKVLIPFRKEFVKQIDLNNKMIELDLIEGFLE